jgi:hypothetical protein
LVEADVSAKRAVCIFRPEVMSWDSEELYGVAGGGSLKEKANQDRLLSLRLPPQAVLYNPSEHHVISAPKMETARFSETLASTKAVHKAP